MEKRKKAHRYRLEFRLLPSLAMLRKSASEVSSGERAKEWAAFASGAAIRNGDMATDHLVTIANWKAPRAKSRVAGNDPADVTDALRICLDAASDRAAVAVLTGLRGVNVPMASAILTAIDQYRFTVIDVRALATLGVQRRYPSVQDFCDYVVFCRSTAAASGMSLRDFDLGIWGLGPEYLN